MAVLLKLQAVGLQVKVYDYQWQCNYLWKLAQGYSYNAAYEIQDFAGQSAEGTTGAH